jgi:MFS transporter, MHS family, proline/betaine transporter
VTAMAVPTFLVGALPGYHTLGMAAPILLTLLRMIQGLSVGGENATAMVFLVEQAPPGRRGLLGALALSGGCGGILLGSLVGTLFSAAMPTAILDAWGWRLPFLLGLLVGFAGRALRRQVVETPPSASTPSPLLETLTHHLPLVARLAGLAAFNAVGFYLMFLYVVSWLQFADGIAPAHALAINTVSLLFVIPVMLAAGWLSDRVGRKRVLTAAFVAGLFGSVPLFWLMHHAELAPILLGQLGFAVIVGASVGPQASAMIEASPLGVRCTAVALGFNASIGIIGGLTPLAAQWLIQRTADDLSPAWMMTAAAAVSLVAVAFCRETFQDSFDAGGALAPAGA